MTEAGEQEEAIEAQPCPICRKNALVLTEHEQEVPYFGKVYLFSMTCTSCKFHKADVESVDDKEPCRYTLDVSSEEDMKIRVVKSSQATVKIPHIATIEPGEASNGYVTNVEGIINRIKHQLEVLRDSEEDEEAQKKARNMLKKLNRVTWGSEKIKLIIDDPSGNSAIISDKAEKKKL